MVETDDEIMTSLTRDTYLGPRERTNHFNMRHTRYDRNGRVTELVLGSTRVQQFWDLPEYVGRLSMLRKLEVRYCQSLPTGLGSLRKLESLLLFQCDGRSLLNDEHEDSSARNFPEVTTLEVKAGLWDETSMMRAVKWIMRADSFPKLMELRFLSLENSLLSILFDALSSISITEGRLVLNRNLLHLRLDFCGMTDDQLRQLLMEILPYFPNLESLSVRGNKIKTLQFLHAFRECTPSDDLAHCALSSILRTLSLAHNPVLRHKRNPMEARAFVVLLRDCFPSVGSLLLSWEDWEPEVEYWLRVNRGGRALFMDGRGDTPSRKLPLSMWPTVLEAAYRTSSRGFKPERKDATALYYLIRKGPVLSDMLAEINAAKELRIPARNRHFQDIGEAFPVKSNNIVSPASSPKQCAQTDINACICPDGGGVLLTY